MLSKIAVAATIVVSLVFAGTAFAGKPASSSIAGPFLVGGSSPTDAAAVAPQFGQTITFNVSTTATSNPFVNVNCYQNGALVMNSWSAFFPGGRTRTSASIRPPGRAEPPTARRIRHVREQRQVEGARLDQLTVNA